MWEISQLRLWAICTHILAEKGESISVAASGACMSFADFDTDLSRDVSLLRLIAVASSI